MRTKLVLAALAMTAASALADDEGLPPVADKTTLKECGACHMAFQPQFLPQRSWRKIMDTLSDHFGEDVSLPDDLRKPILEYLLANAGDVSRQEMAREFVKSIPAGQTPLRITEVPYWQKEHRRIREKEWTSAQVKSRSNCMACHEDAAAGFYENN